MDIAVLGPLEVRVDGQPIDLGGPRQRTVLALLVANADQSVSTDRLVDQIWGERPPPSAANTVQSYVSRIRRLLPGAIRAGRGTYSLSGAACSIDARSFEELARHAGSSADPAELAATLRKALGLWRGTPYEGLDDTPSLADERHRLEELRLATLERRFEAELEIGLPDDLLPELEVLVERHALRERLSEQLMTGLYRAGRQSDALEIYRRLRHNLANELGIEPSRRLHELEERILNHDPSLEGPTVAHPMWATSRAAVRPRATSTFAIELTSFVGRRRELEELELLLDTHRMVTVTGPGGSGKTRLALRVGRAIAERFTGGVVAVDLATVSAPDLVPAALAAALGIDEVPGVALLDQLPQALADRSLLLLLDNCEHVAEGVASLATTLLTRCEALTVLATSRQGLHVPSEVRFEVPPLEVPPSDPGSIEAALQFDAVRLFYERGRAARAGLDLAAADLSPLVSICRRVHGIPLAVELAAARASVLTVAEIDQLLGTSLDALGKGASTLPRRQQTLAATVDWSYQLLSEGEQRLFEALSVFAGDFSLAAASHVGGIEQMTTLNLVESLVDKSLVHADPRAGRTRFSLLDVIARFGLDRLAARSEATATRARHLDYYAGLLDSLAGPLAIDDPELVPKAIAPEYHELRVAIDFALSEGRLEEAFRLAEPLADYLLLTASYAELRALVAALSDATTAGPPELTVRALELALDTTWWGGDWGSGDLALLRRILDLASPSSPAFALAQIGLAGLKEVGPDEARRSLLALRRAGDKRRLLTGLRKAAVMAGWENRIDEAEALGSEALRLAAEEGDLWRRIDAAFVLGQVAYARGEMWIEEMEPLLRLLERWSPRTVFWRLAWTGTAKMRHGEIETAERLLEAAHENAMGRAHLDDQRHAMSILAICSRLRGDSATTAQRMGRVVDGALAAGVDTTMPWYLEVMAGLAVAEGNARLAALLFGAAQRLREAGGIAAAEVPMPSWDRPQYDQDVAGVRASLTPIEFKRLWQEGRRLSLDEALELARRLAISLQT